MKQRTALALFVAAVVCAVALGSFVALQNAPVDSTVAVTPTAPEETREVPAPKIQTIEEIERNNANGPWKRDLMTAVSANGTTFSEPEVFVERAGVPSVVREGDGRLVAAFQWFPEDVAAWDKVAVAFSEDDGATWTDPETIVVEGLPEGYQRPFDPTVAVTEDERIRLYFTTTVGRPGPNADMHIASAISDDGVSYVFEPGERLVEDGVRLFDAAALRFGDAWHLTTPLHAEGASHATSADGIDFTRVDNIGAFPAFNWTGNLLAWNDGMRFYGSGPGNIWWSETSDGFDWSAPTATNLRGGDPGVVELESGEYLIIYVSEPTR